MLSPRARSLLHREGITTLEALQAKSPEELLAIRGFGVGVLEEVNRFLSAQNLSVFETAAADQSTLSTNAQTDTSLSMTASLESNPFFGVLSTRTRRILFSAEISSLADLKRTDKASLLSLKGFGEQCLFEVNRFVEMNTLRSTVEAPSPEGQFVIKTLGLEDLQEYTRNILRQIGIGTAEELRAWGLREILEAAGYDETTSEDVMILSRLTRPEDQDDLLALLFVSGVAREALARVSGTESYDFFDKTMELYEQVRSQVERGTLHERAAMDWAPLRTLNHALHPPVRTLPDLLQAFQYQPESKVLDAVDSLNETLGVSSLEDDLELLFSQLDKREAEVIRQRLAVGQRGTLAALGTHFGVSRERIRQIEKEAGSQLQQVYYEELPLLRIRTAMLLIREHQIFAIPDMVRFLEERGLTTSEMAVRELLVIWQALDLNYPDIHDSFVEWKVLDPEVYAFPEEILSVAKTGLTPRQQALAKETLREARRMANRFGVTTTGQIMEALNQEDPLTVEDLVAILLNSGFQEVLPNHWTTARGEYSIPRDVVSKMLSVCGPLNLKQLRRGLLRHQKRLGFFAPPIAVLGPMLAHHDIFEIDEDGVCSFKNPDLHLPNLGLAEQVWVETAKTHGPVVHSHHILQAFREKGLKKATAYRLMTNSPLVQKVGQQLFILPGAHITDVDVKAGREQGVWGRSSLVLNASRIVRQNEPVLTDLEPLMDDSQEESEPLAGKPVWARLQYEAGENRLSMALPETTWQGDVSVRLSWEGQEFDLPTNYLPAEDLTTSGTATLPLNDPFWETEGLLLAGHSLRVVRFPQPPAKHGLVFRASDGKVLRRWRTGEEHYVVVSTQRMSEEKAAEIFDEWHSLGRPEGWETFTALWVRTKDPLGQGGRADASAVIDSFSQATRELGLPDFDSLWRPRPRLVGGESLGSFEGRERFTPDRPPYLEVNGLWDSALNVSLSRWIPGSVEFVQVETLRLPPPVEANCLVEIWSTGESPREDCYRVEIGDQQVEFDITSSAPLSFHSRPTIDLALQRDGEAVGESGLTRRDLEVSILVGRAWPGARLIFTVTSGPWSHSLAVTADDEGNWSIRWRDLGVPAIPAGLLKLELSWRGLIGSELIIADEPFVLEDNVDLSFRVRESEKSLVLSGVVSSVGPNRQARAVLLGEHPWTGEMWTQEMTLDERGAFEAQFYNVCGEVRWLLILPGKIASESASRSPWLIQAQSEGAPRAVYRVERLEGERPDAWEELADELRGAPLPPALTRLIELSDLGGVLERVAQTSTGKSQWMPAGEPRDLRRLLSWQRFGMRIAVGVFSPETPVAEKTPNEELPPLLTVGLETLSESLDHGAGELSLECVTHEGHRRRIKGTVALNEANSDNGFELRAEELLYACPRCGLILPPAEFSNHPPPGDDMPSCTAGRHALRLISAGKNKPVTLLMKFDTEEIGSALKEMVRRVITGDEEDVPDHAEPWLDSLQEAYFEEGGDQEPEVWLDTLYSLHERLRSARGRDESEVRLADLGRSARRCESGLDVLARWLNSEVG